MIPEGYMGDGDSLISSMQERSGIQDRAKAEFALATAWQIWGKRLPEELAAEIASRLPSPSNRWLRRDAAGQDLELDTMIDELASKENVDPGFALEHLQVAGQLLVETSGGATLYALRRVLPPKLVDLLRPVQWNRRSRPAGPNRPHRSGANDRYGSERPHTTLASGRPGSPRPMSEDTPAQRPSILRSKEPRASRKLSSSDATPDREGESLSTSRPGSRRQAMSESE